MSIIKKQDFIDSVADALQYISYYHPLDFVHAAKAAYDREINPAAKDALAQILINSRMSAEGHRPLCQDTGIVTCFVKIGMQVQWDSDMTVQEMVDEGTRRAYTNPDNPLRASVLADPAGSRKNTKDNAPAVVHIDMIPGNKVEVSIAAKGGGSENKSKMVMLNPSDDVVEWVLKTVPTMGAGWCPPGMLGIGIGGTAEKAMLLAKEALMDDIDMFDLLKRGPQTDEEKLRIVAESHCAGANLSDVARRHEISRAQLYEWRYRHRLGLLVGGPSSFTQLTCTPERDHAEEPPVFGMTVGTAAPAALTVELGGRYRVTIPSDFDMEAAARLLNGLKVTR